MSNDYYFNLHYKMTFLIIRIFSFKIMFYKDKLIHTVEEDIINPLRAIFVRGR